MEPHFTYTLPEGADLRQGDVLVRSQVLEAALGSAGQQALDSQYVAYLVTTQSCDLVRRKGAKPSASHVGLAPVLPLEIVLRSLFDSVAEPIHDGVYAEEDRHKVEGLLDRIFNQNEQHLGLFYLHEDEQVGLSMPCLAMLRRQFSVEAQCYEALLAGRRGALIPEFRAKLGWLIGFLYARAATPDWSAKELSELRRRWLRAHDEYVPQWVPRAWARAAMKAGIELTGDASEVVATLQAFRPQDSRSIAQVLAARLKAVGAAGDISEQKLLGRLTNDPVILHICKSAQSGGYRDDA